MIIAFASGGNDSVALVQHLHEIKKTDVIVAYSNTGWASASWKIRMAQFKEWVERIGFKYHEIPSEGMEALIRRKKAWPANRPKFCTYELKIAPAKAWLDTVDPDKSAVCCVGIRRAESVARRTWPLWTYESENHGFRDLWAPLVDLTDEQRDALVLAAGFQVLPHRSKECSPCVNANRADFRSLDKEDIEKVRRNEAETGRTMFRPHRFHGATGIDEVMKWAWSERGKYGKEESGCDSGMCGD